MKSAALKNDSPNQAKPYEVVGAGELTATVWKSGSENTGWHYSFNVFRQCCGSGEVSQLYRPSDLLSLVKLCQVLAFTLVDDGCVSRLERNESAQLVARLDAVTRAETKTPDEHPR